MSITGLTELTQNHHLQIPRPQIVHVKAQRPVQMLQSLHPVFPRTINFRQCLMACPRPGLVPRCFVKRIIRFLVTVEIAQAQTKIVIRLAVIRICIAVRETLDCLVEMPFGLGKFTAPETPQTHRIVATGVKRIAPQRFIPIQHR